MNEYDTVEHTGEDKKGNKKLMFTKDIIYLSVNRKKENRRLLDRDGL